MVHVPLGVKTQTSFDAPLFGQEGKFSFGLDLSFTPQFGKKDTVTSMTGATTGISDTVRADFADSWIGAAGFGLMWRGEKSAFSFTYGAQKGDVRDWTHSVGAKAAFFF